MTFLITGVAGFIGYHLAQRLLDQGNEVAGVDNLNDYYDVRLKEARLARLQGRANYQFFKIDIAERSAMARVFSRVRPRRVLHMAAQAGVRYSLTNPFSYVDSNLAGFVSVLEGCRHHGVEHLVYASSSSVYGANSKIPFSVQDNVDHPVSLYAATKKANELMAHTYSHLYGLPTTGLRFFTVYGPWGRPDMAVFLFTKAIIESRPIDVFNEGRMHRDFTYIDDIVEAVIRVADRLPQRQEAECRDGSDGRISHAPYRIYNIGNNKPIALLDLIKTLEDALGRQAEKRMLPMQAGDIPITFADIGDLMRDIGFKPTTSIEVGVRRFIEWFKDFYRTK